MVQKELRTRWTRNISVHYLIFRFNRNRNKATTFIGKHNSDCDTSTDCPARREMSDATAQIIMKYFIPNMTALCKALLWGIIRDVTQHGCCATFRCALGQNGHSCLMQFNQNTTALTKLHFHNSDYNSVIMENGLLCRSW